MLRALTAILALASVLAGRNVIACGRGAFDAVRAVPGTGDRVTIGAGRAHISGSDGMARDDLAVLAIVPNPDGRTLVGVVAGTGEAGERLCDQVPLFVSGIGYPDWSILGPEMLERGFEGVIGCGFFDQAWAYDPSQSAWNR